MLCKHGNTAPCVECDIGPLNAENEALRRDISALVEALECALETMENVDGANDCSRGIDAAEEALAAHRKGGCK